MNFDVEKRNNEIYVNYKGEEYKANQPVIISASRSTDIPAFFSNWLLRVLEKGITYRINPFNNKPYFISFDKARFIVFWTKNPQPIIDKLERINSYIAPDSDDYQFYFQYTLNDYEKEKLEPKVPPLKTRIETFKELSEKIGREKVIWRFDPLILTDSITIDRLIEKIGKIGEEIYKYTEKLVFSFADIGVYRKVKINMKSAGINYLEFNQEKMLEFAEKLADLNKKWGLKLSTCCEQVDLTLFGIEKNKCIDDELIERISKRNPEIMEKLYGKKNYNKYLQLLNNKPLFDTGEWEKELNELRKKLKDKGQRESCGCVKSTDIGAYNTCKHLCVYCYANTSPEIVEENYKKLRSENG